MQKGSAGADQSEWPGERKADRGRSRQDSRPEQTFGGQRNAVSDFRNIPKSSVQNYSSVVTRVKSRNLHKLKSSSFYFVYQGNSSRIKQRNLEGNDPKLTKSKAKQRKEIHKPCSVDVP